MGISQAEYRQLVAAQGKPLSSGACAGERMSAKDFRDAVLNGSLSSRAFGSKSEATAPARPLAGNTRKVDATPAEQPAPSAPAKKPKAQPEFHEQCALFEWSRNPAVRMQYPALRLLSASLNGVKLTKAQAGKAKAAGMLTGESDVRLPVARGGFAGLLVEMKHGRNTATEEQLAYGADMEAEGHKFHVCYSWEEARAVITDYLDMPRTTLSLG